MQSILRFFFPTKISGDIVSHMYVWSFRINFCIIATISFFYYFFLNYTNIGNMISIFLFSPASVFSDKGEMSYHPNINGLFFAISFLVSVVVFAKNMKKIPPDIYDIGRSHIPLIISLFWAFVCGIAFVKIGNLLDQSKDITFGRIMFVMALSYSHAFMSLIFIRQFLVLSATSGFRKTKKNGFFRNIK